MKTVIAGIVGGIVVLIGMLLLRPAAAPAPPPTATRMVANATATKSAEQERMADLADYGRKAGVVDLFYPDDNEYQVRALSTRVADLEKKNCPYQWVPC